MANTVAPTPSSKAPKPQRSPPTAEELCLQTFKTCWYLDKTWLVDFVVSAQHATPSSPITWVKFMPKGHTHLVRSALKLVPLTKHLPVAKIKEVMFTYILIVLNGSGSTPDFFNARKVAKPRKRTSKRGKGGSQPVGMAVDTPPPSDLSPPRAAPGNAPLGDVSTPAPSAGAGNPEDKGEVRPGPSSEAPGADSGSTSVEPRASSSSTEVSLPPVPEVLPQVSVAFA